jgi:rod shape-determining protein MreD
MALAYFQREVDVLCRLAPFASCLVAVILSVVPVPVPGLAVATPAFALMAIYHWTVYRPDLLPASAVFVIGILLDLLDGTPYLGLTPLTFLVARTVILLGRRAAVNQGFPLVWAGFTLVALGTVALQWLAVELLSGTALAARAFFFQAAVTAAAYPICDYILAQVQGLVLRRV